MICKVVQFPFGLCCLYVCCSATIYKMYHVCYTLAKSISHKNLNRTREGKVIEQVNGKARQGGYFEPVFMRKGRWKLELDWKIGIRILKGKHT